jgi:ADP-heptose:LPS heptosyltransferase
LNRPLLIFLDKTVFTVIFYFVYFFDALFKKTAPINGLKSNQSTSFLKNFPRNHITLMCVRKNRDAFQHLSFLDEVMVFDSLRDFTSNLIKLFRNEYNIVLDLEPFRKVSSIVAFLSGAEFRIGFDTNVRRKLYTHFVTYHNEKSYESVNMVRQLTVLDITGPGNEALDMGFDLPVPLNERVGALLQSRGVEPKKDILVAVAPGVLKPHHRWIMSRFAELVEMIRKEDIRTKILLIGSPSDLPDARKVLKHIDANERVISLVGETTFSEALAVLSHCKILIACDGGLVYMAAAMGCGTISLWGPGVMDRFKPPGDNHIGIRKDYFCIPCVNYSRLGEFPPCPYHRRCYMDITAEEIFDQYLSLKAMSC